MNHLGASWILWLLSTLALGGYLLVVFQGDDQRFILPGETTHGHYQIEMQCSACHDEGNNAVRQDACLGCHLEELERVDDSHPIEKFAKPLDALKLRPIDARMSGESVKTRYCITCHIEHSHTRTGDMGLTMPVDICASCHTSIYEERETHAGLGFDTCLTAGCHNYHDNSSLYENFLTTHIDDAHYVDDPVRPLRDYGERYRAEQAAIGKPVVALTRSDNDAPPDAVTNENLADWSTTAHAAAGVNCADCHEQDDGSGTKVWRVEVAIETCSSCHENETKGFLASRHGMRLAQGLSPMTPGMARLQMRDDAASHEMTCSACHPAHNFDTRHAAVDACLQCHNDDHSIGYKHTLHYDTWLEELSGHAPPGSGVSCATCHLPRVLQGLGAQAHVIVAHNQNDYLRPNEKQIRASCAHCHGVPFAIDALADEGLIAHNFHRPPETPHFTPSSFDLIRQKLEKLERRNTSGV